MLIGIDASRAFLRRRTGIEEYAYQVIGHLRFALPEDTRVVLYVRSDQDVTLDLPRGWQAKKLWSPRLWTQARLSLEMFLHPPDVLFVPAHTVPLIHPKKTVVTIHGLEYEFCPKAYSLWERLYMRCSIRFSCRAAKTVVCVSENTKRDVMRLYGVRPEKIKVVYEGYEKNLPAPLSHLPSNPHSQFPISKPYLLFIGRLEERKNIIRIIEAFKILKEKYRIPHRLVLVGKPGHGYQKIKSKIEDLESEICIEERGYVTEEEKWELLLGTEAFLFPTLYEGFGIPVLEAQSVGVPVVTSDVSSLPEVGGEGAVYVDPKDAESIAGGIWKLLSDADVRDDIMMKGSENAKKFSWEKCAVSIAEILTQER